MNSASFIIRSYILQPQWKYGRGYILFRATIVIIVVLYYHIYCLTKNGIANLFLCKYTKLNENKSYILNILIFNHFRKCLPQTNSKLQLIYYLCPYINHFQCNDLASCVKRSYRILFSLLHLIISVCLDKD